MSFEKGTALAIELELHSIQLCRKEVQPSGAACMVGCRSPTGEGVWPAWARYRGTESTHLHKLLLCLLPHSRPIKGGTPPYPHSTSQARINTPGSCPCLQQFNLHITFNLSNHLPFRPPAWRRRVRRTEPLGFRPHRSRGNNSLYRPRWGHRHGGVRLRSGGRSPWNKNKPSLTTCNSRVRGIWSSSAPDREANREVQSPIVRGGCAPNIMRELRAFGRGSRCASTGSPDPCSR